MAVDLLCPSAVGQCHAGWSACPLRPAVFKGFQIFSKARHLRQRTQSSLPNRHIRFCKTGYFVPHTGRAEAEPEGHVPTQLHFSCRMSSTAGGADLSSTAGPREVPEGMQEEAHLLYDLCKIPTISKVWCRGAGTLQLTVRLPWQCCREPGMLTCCLHCKSPLAGLTCLLACPQVQQTQHNLASNSKRNYIRAFQVVAGQEDTVASFPVEQQGVQMMSVSPSGDTLL